MTTRKQNGHRARSKVGVKTQRITCALDQQTIKDLRDVLVAHRLTSMSAGVREGIRRYAEVLRLRKRGFTIFAIPQDLPPSIGISGAVQLDIPVD